jgi:NAD(P)-dependent dehydrogenase (short-subunit alcohol dehydrogenase family)
MQIEESIALVTGANRGIGRAFVEALLERGVRRVYATARNPSSLPPVTAPDPSRVETLKLDVTSREDARAAAARARDVTLLINNAAVLSFGSMLDLPTDAARADMETNFFGTLNVINAFVPVLEANGGGAIVNMLTVVALASMPGLAAYTASKAAAWSLTQSYRADLAERGVLVHGVFPGPVDTDMIRDVEMPKTPPAEVARAVLDGVAAGDEDIFPDGMSREVYAAWRQDHKAVERQFSTL